MSIIAKWEFADELYDKLLDELFKLGEFNPDLKFTLRKSDLGSKLQRRFWFYGNNRYISISCWSGFDYINRTPNVSLIINLIENKHVILFTGRDDAKKYELYKEFIFPQLKHAEIKPTRYGQYIIELNQSNPIEALYEFLDYKSVIDEAIEKNRKAFLTRIENDLNAIFTITSSEFSRNLQRISRYKRKTEIKKRPVSIARFVVQEYEPIKFVNSGDIDADVKFIFITGKNGTGKTSVLKALTTAICKGYDGDRELSKKQGYYNLDVFLHQDNKIAPFKCHPLDIKPNGGKIVSGFAAYGTSRLITSNRELRPTVNALGADLTSLTHSIFHHDGILLDLSRKIVEWKSASMDLNLQSRIDNMIRALTRIGHPKLNNIYVKNDTTYYEELDDNGVAFPPVEFEELASGLKSIIAMMGDMMIRLFEQQPELDDPSELEGIVLIDEIDVHLHPTLQKDIIEKLSSLFPNIQFIVTTHSPMPILGAPLNSVIYRSDRNSKDGTTLTRLSEKVDFSNLLPNTLLTSPIFGMEELRPSSNSDIRRLNIDGHFDEKLFFKIVDNKIAEYTKDSEWDKKLKQDD